MAEEVPFSPLCFCGAVFVHRCCCRNSTNGERSELEPAEVPGTQPEGGVGPGSARGGSAVRRGGWAAAWGAAL